MAMTITGVTGFEVEYNERWDPRHYDDRDLIPAIGDYMKTYPGRSPCGTFNPLRHRKPLFCREKPLSKKMGSPIAGQPEVQCGLSGVPFPSAGIFL